MNPARVFQDYPHIWKFPKILVPNNHGFPNKIIVLGCFGGYQHLRKHRYPNTLLVVFFNPLEPNFHIWIARTPPRRVQIKRSSPKHRVCSEQRKYLYLAILCDLFGMVKWPFQMLLVTSNDRGWKGHSLNHLASGFFSQKCSPWRISTLPPGSKFLWSFITSAQMNEGIHQEKHPMPRVQGGALLGGQCLPVDVSGYEPWLVSPLRIGLFYDPFPNGRTSWLVLFRVTNHVSKSWNPSSQYEKKMES